MLPYCLNDTPYIYIHAQAVDALKYGNWCGRFLSGETGTAQFDSEFSDEATAACDEVDSACKV